MSTLSRREMAVITLCLAVVCLIAGLILGITYRITEPVKQEIAAKNESVLISQMLGLSSTDNRVVEVHRFASTGDTPQFGYAHDGRWLLVDENGAVVAQETIDVTTADEITAWVSARYPTMHLVGRFFIAYQADNSVAGYVTEGVQQGFKAHIRFLVALTPDFTLRGVEVLSHEEDPGLGAEITQPLFKNQFIGLSASALEKSRVEKGPMPDANMAQVIGRTFETAPAATGDGATIYGVTGATISSRSLVEGVKKSVGHLQHRLSVLSHGEQS